MKLGKLLISLVIVSLLVSMALPMVSAPKPGGGKPPKEPANPMITFSQGVNMERLMVMDEDGSHQTQVYRSGMRHIYDPSWSPDGGCIVFSHLRFMGGPDGELWAVDVTLVDGKPQGSDARLLLDNCYTGEPAWSPLGHEIAIVNEPRPTGEATALQIIPASGGSPETLYSVPLEPGYMLQNPTWNAMGTQIAFVEKFPYQQPHIKIIDRNTKEIITTLLEGEYVVLNMDWGKTQDVIAFSGRPYGGQGVFIYIVDIVSGDVTFIVEGQYPTWSPDDTHIAFQGPFGDGVIKSIEISSGQIKSLTQKSGYMPDWRRA